MIAVWSYIIYELYDTYINLFYLFMSITLYQYWNCTSRNKEIIRTEMTAIALLYRAQTWLSRPWFKVTGPWTENIRSSKSKSDRAISPSESIHFQIESFNRDRLLWLNGFRHRTVSSAILISKMMLQPYRWTLVENQTHHSVSVGFYSSDIRVEYFNMYI